MRLRVVLSLACACGVQVAHAGDFGTFDGVDIRLDDSLRTTLGLRTEGPNAALLANPNGDDGDRAFTPGLISERVDLLSELDITDGDLGFDGSFDAWYDAAYHQRNANNSPATFNPVSVPHNQFPRDTAALQGNTIDLLNANIHDRITLFGLPLAVRLGRQTLLWGESLFFAANGIAAGQAPVDEIKALGQPLAQAKEVFLPVTQATASLQLSRTVTFEAYYQFEWRRNRTPGVSSYFSSFDALDVGGERLFYGGPTSAGANTAPPGPAGPPTIGPYALAFAAPKPRAGVLLRAHDQAPPGPGQFGAALRFDSPAIDLGLYALRFDAKSPELALTALPAGTSSGLGQYAAIYPRGIELYGASFSTYLGDGNLAGEISLRRHMPLVSAQPMLPASIAGVPLTNAAYAVGDTLHAQLSLVSELPPGRFFDGASFQAEIAGNDLLQITDNPTALAAGRNRFAVAMRAVLSPNYFEVAPRLDISVPIGFGYGIVGNSSVDGGQNAHAGDIEIGISATYRTVWQASLMFTHFLGAASRQPLADRDFVTMSAARSF